MVKIIHIISLADEIKKVREDLNEENGCLENIVFEKHNSGASIEGNRSGLFELARQILLLAASSDSGGHIDIDEASFASKSDGVLTISLNDTL